MNKTSKALISLAFASLLAAATISAQEHKIPVLSDYFSPSTEIPVSPDKDGFVQRWGHLQKQLK